MELTCLRSFREVAVCGSYTKAAEQLGYAQSSVTAQIQKLEETYRAVLLERRGRAMGLTAAGEKLLEYANEILRLYSESLEAVASASGGSLTIGSIETLASYYLPPYMQAYRAGQPQAYITLQPGNEPELIRGVKSGMLDAAFILDPLLLDPELSAAALREETLVIVCPPDHRLARQRSAAVTELAGESLVLTEHGCTYRGQLLRRLKETGTEARISCELGSVEAIKQCVQHGLGIALLPGLAVQREQREGTLAAVRLKDESFQFVIQLIYSRKKWMSPGFRSFLEAFGV
ncbi:LysR family transcriptional regulator [Paenibacillus pasadenensis]|uniref:LysR family transcriptional regulator n=1 Tax=Paenibacillus pasadenensis TaxID=217090 RepID=UPI0020412B2C|nr:LysR family transcriptional regulator [Paenibacillus pasadenensis]MCM3745761.1 LysR family transcriptional regulator [Paenibacillus pasadenensis]